MSTTTTVLTAYETLGVDPSAPADLVTAVYWMVVSDLQLDRAAGKPVDAELHAATRAYELISDVERRGRYDDTIGYTARPVIVRKLGAPRRSLLRRLLRRHTLRSDIDYYEIVGLSPSAPATRVEEAYRIMRDHYLRAPNGRQRRLLVRLLEESRRVLADEDQRAAFDERRASRKQPTRTDASAPAVSPSPDAYAHPLVVVTKAPDARPLPITSVAAPEQLEVVSPPALATEQAAPPRSRHEPATRTVERLKSSEVDVQPSRGPGPAPVRARFIHTTVERVRRLSAQAWRILKAVARASGAALRLLSRALAAALLAALRIARAGGSKIRLSRAHSTRPAAPPTSPSAPPARPSEIGQPLNSARRRRRDEEDAFLERLASRVGEPAAQAPADEDFSASA